MSKLEEEQTRKGEEMSKDIQGVQKALKELTKSLTESKSEKGKKRKIISPKLDEESKTPKRSFMELMERADDSEEGSFSEGEYYFDSEADQGDQSERSRRSDSSEEEDTIDIKPS